MSNRRSTGPVLATVCLALGAVVSTVASLNLAIPNLAQDTGATQTELNWIIDAYALTFAALLLPAGALGDRIGRRRVLVAGLAVFAAAGVSVLWLTTPGQVIAIRAVMGVAAALIMPATLSTVTGTFDEADRVKGVAVWAGVAGASAVLGLLVSGLVLHWWGWQSVFVATSAVAVLALVLSTVFVPESADPAAAANDPVGAVLAAAGLFAVVYGVIEAPTHDWGSAHTLGWIGAGLAGVVVFLLWEARTPRPMLDPRLFRRPRFAAGTLSLLLQFFAFFGLVYVFLMYVQLVRGWSPLETACAMLPMPAGLIPTARLAPRLVDRLGQAPLCTAGLLLLATGINLLAHFDAATPYWQMACVLFPLGIGMGLAMPPATTAITDSLPRAEQGVASAMNDLARELGGALGIAVLGSVLNSTYRTSLDLPASVPQPAAEAARESLAAALAIAGRAGGPQGAWLADHARTAFQSGLTHAMTVASIVLAVGAGLVLSLLLAGRRRPAHRTQTAAPAAPVATAPAAAGAPVAATPEAGAPAPTAAAPTAAAPAGAKHEPEFITYPFPLRPGLRAHLELPEDLTASEADRLGAHLRTLVVSPAGARPAEREVPSTPPERADATRAHPASARRLAPAPGR